MTTQHTSAATITERRLELHESAARDLRRGNYREAAWKMRRLLLTLPPDHEARHHLLTVLALTEQRRPANTNEEQS